MQILLGLLKFLTGVSLAIAILFFSGMYTVRYAMTRLTTVPERPVFPDEIAASSPEDAATSAEAEATDANPTGETEGALDSVEDSAVTNETADSTTEAETAAAADTEAETEADSETTDDEAVLEAGAYRAKVVQPIGLILREGPNVSTIQLGGVAFNEELIVLSESSDGRWINVRLPGSDVEGWVKNGNTEPLAE